jgi:hypothetical protein
MSRFSKRRLVTTGILAAVLMLGLGPFTETRFAWLSYPFVGVGPYVAGFIFREGIHSDNGLAFLGLMIALDFLFSWLLVLAASEFLVFALRGRKTAR